MHTAQFHRVDPVAVQHKQLVKQSQKWVAQMFYGTLLKQAQDDPFKSEVMDGGRGGKMFGEMLNQQLADHMSRSSGSKITNAIVDGIERHKAKDAGMSLKKWHAAHGIKTPHVLNVRA